MDTKLNSQNFDRHDFTFEAAHINHVLLGQLGASMTRSGIGPSKRFGGMIHVGLMSHPLKVVSPVVMWVAILVVALMALWTWTNKRNSDKRVDIVVFGVSKAEGCVPLPSFGVDVRLQNATVEPVVSDTATNLPRQRSHASKIGHIVSSLKTSDRLPNLNFGCDRIGLSHDRSFQRLGLEPETVNQHRSGSVYFTTSRIGNQQPRV